MGRGAPLRVGIAADGAGGRERDGIGGWGIGFGGCSCDEDEALLMLLTVKLVGLEDGVVMPFCCVLLHGA